MEQVNVNTSSGQACSRIPAPITIRAAQQASLILPALEDHEHQAAAGSCPEVCWSFLVAALGVGRQAERQLPVLELVDAEHRVEFLRIDEGQVDPFRRL